MDKIRNLNNFSIFFSSPFKPLMTEVLTEGIPEGFD